MLTHTDILVLHTVVWCTCVGWWLPLLDCKVYSSNYILLTCMQTAADVKAYVLFLTSNNGDEGV